MASYDMAKWIVGHVVLDERQRVDKVISESLDHKSSDEEIECQPDEEIKCQCCMQQASEGAK